MIFRLSFLVLVSVAVLSVSQVKRAARKMKQDSKPHMQRRNNVSEMELLHNNLRKELEKRRLVVEGKLLQLYGLKEQQSCIAQLGTHLEEKMAEIQMLNDAANSLQDEIKNLREEMKQAALTERQLGMAKRVIEELQMKINVNTRHMRQQLIMLEEQVSRFRGNEISVSDAVIEKKLQLSRQVELESLEMQRRNKELELEKRELAVKLVGAQARITALSTMTDAKIIAKIGKEMSSLRHANEDLSKEVERLQKNRFNMVEELVYQRWLNACLRFEIQDYQTPSSRKTSSSDYLCNNGSHSSDKKAKELVLYPSFHSISSHTSSTESISSSQRSIGKKSNVMQRIKKWGSNRTRTRSKDDLSSCASSTNKSPIGIGLIRRCSASMVPSRPSVLLSTKAESVAGTESPCTPNLPRARRVSFCDAVEEKKAEKGMCSEKSDENSAIDVSTKCAAAKLADEQKIEASLRRVVITLPKHLHDYPSCDERVELDDDHIQVDRRIETTHTDIAAAAAAPFTASMILFLVFVLLLYFLFKTLHYIKLCF